MKLYILLIVVGLVLASGCVNNQENLYGSGLVDGYTDGLRMCIANEVVHNGQQPQDWTLENICASRNEKAAKWDELEKQPFYDDQYVKGFKSACEHMGGTFESPPIICLKPNEKRVCFNMSNMEGMISPIACMTYNTDSFSNIIISQSNSSLVVNATKSAQVGGSYYIIVNGTVALNGSEFQIAG